MRVAKNKWLITTLFSFVFMFAWALCPSPAQAIVQTTGGDGYVPIIYQDRVYNIFHHKSPNGDPNNPEYSINCAVRSTGQTCTDYPRYFSTTPGSSGKPGVGTPGSANIHTPNTPQATIEGSRLFYAASTDTNNGVGCFDLDLAINCAGTSFFNLGNIGATGGPGNRTRIDGVERIGNKVYSIAADIGMYCLDITNVLSPVACGGQPYALNAGITSDMPSYDGPTFFGTRHIVNGRIYVSVQYFNQSTPAVARMTCFDSATAARCAGWTGATSSVVLGSFANFYISIFSDLTTSGTPSAVCVGSRPADPVRCYDLLTGATMPSAPNVYSVVPPGSQPNSISHEDVVVGTKMYMSFSNSVTEASTLCWDFATGAGCSGFGSNGYRSWNGSTGGGSVNGGVTRDYGYTALRTCILGLGDAGVLWSFDGATGSLPGAEDCAVGPQCFDGGDNDGDGNIDFPSDTGCTSLADISELLLIPGGSFNVIPGLPQTGVEPTSNNLWPLGLSGLGVLMAVLYLLRRYKVNLHPRA